MAACSFLAWTGSLIICLCMGAGDSLLADAAAEQEPGLEVEEQEPPTEASVEAAEANGAPTPPLLPPQVCIGASALRLSSLQTVIHFVHQVTRGVLLHLS